MKISRIQETFRQMHTTGFLKDQSGSVFLEYSVALLCFLVVVFGTMELCSAAYAYTVLADAANEGVHFAIVNSSNQNGAINMVTDYAKSSLHDVSNLHVAVTYPDGSMNPPSRVAVSVSYPYLPYFTFLMNDPPTMHAYAEGMMVR